MRTASGHKDQETSRSSSVPRSHTQEVVQVTPRDFPEQANEFILSSTLSFAHLSIVFSSFSSGERRLRWSQAGFRITKEVALSLSCVREPQTALHILEKKGNGENTAPRRAEITAGKPVLTPTSPLL